MERTTLALRRAQPSPRTARKSEWLRSALAHHHLPDPGAENEIVVLATGIDQYLQEVFHHLAYPNRDDTVSAEDFTALCAVLGLIRTETGKSTVKEKGVEGDGLKDDEDDEFRDVCSGLPSQLSFKDFHARLCGYFRVRSARRGTGECAWRLPVTEDTELVEKQIRLRWPRVRRRKCVSFDLSRDQSGPGNRSMKGRTSEDREPDELAALRELVEDLRCALQGSDARCLALEVALRRGSSPTPSASSHSSPVSSITLVQGKLVPTLRIKGTLSNSGGAAGSRAARRRDIRDPLLRELRLIRSSRDGQLEEAMKFNERLEEELQWAYQEVRKLQGVESALRKENAQIRRRAEEAREALSLGLQRVRLIQQQAQSVPQLQARITQLESDLQQYRSRCTCAPDPAGQQIQPEDVCDRTDAECLQRAVEGRAASDEEEEDRGTRGDEVKRHVSRPHSCNRGCQNNVVHRILPQSQDKNHSSTPKDSRGRCSCKGLHQEGSTGFQKTPDADEQQDSEKSLLEDKLTHSLSLLLQNQNVSHGVLRRIVMDTLDVCGRSGAGTSGLHPVQVLQVADVLGVHMSSDLRRGENGGRGGESGDKLLLASGRQPSSSNPLLISC